MKILVLNGPNLNMLGQRERKYYGEMTLAQIEEELKNWAEKHNVELIFYQANCEGKLIDKIQEEASNIDGILINAGALTHYGYALRDALIDAKKPVVVVHLSNIYKREEDFRKKDVLADIAVGGVYGFKKHSYLLGLKALVSLLKEEGYEG